jgi:mono/diheme cytochrome c family protein
LATAAAAQGPQTAGDAARGAEIAQRWCAQCHVAGPDQPAGADMAPAFAAIAADPATTPGGLRAWLVDPHPPMPNPGLSDAQIDDVIAYIATLAP